MFMQNIYLFYDKFLILKSYLFRDGGSPRISTSDINLIALSIWVFDQINILSSDSLNQIYYGPVRSGGKRGTNWAPTL